METDSITCNHCGAPLQIPQGANYVTCTHCGSHLAVRRTPTVVFTELVDKLSATTEQLADHIERLERQQKLDALERRWESQQTSFLVTDSDGRSHLPTETSAMIAGAVAIGFGILWTIFAASVAPFMAMFGILFVAAGIAMSLHRVKKAREFTKAEQRYRRERSRLIRGESEFQPPVMKEQHD